MSNQPDEVSPDVSESGESAPERSRFDSLSLPSEQQQVLRIVTRCSDAGVDEIAAALGHDKPVIYECIKALLQQGFIREILTEGEPRYRTHLAAKRGRLLSEKIWQRLEE